MAIYLSDASNHTMEQFMFESKDVQSNFMSDEIVNVIDSSACESSGDELDKGYYKYSLSAELQEKNPFVGNSTNQSELQCEFVGDGEMLFNPVMFDVKNKSLSENMTRRISHPVKPVSPNVVNKAISSLESLNIQLKKHFPQNRPNKRHKTSKLIKNNEAFCQLGLKRFKLPTVMKQNAFDVRRANMAKLKNRTQSNYSTKHSRTKCKGSRQMICNKKDSGSQCQSTNLTRKRFMDNSLADSEISFQAPNQAKIRKLVSSSSLNCKSLNKYLKKHVDEHIQSNLILFNSGKPKSEKYRSNNPGDISFLISEDQMPMDLLPEIEPGTIKNNFLKHLNGLEQKTSPADGGSIYHKNLLKPCKLSSNKRKLEMENKANFETDTSISKIKRSVSVDHTSSSVNVGKRSNKVNRTTCTNKQLYIRKEKRKRPNKPIINSAKSFIKCDEIERIQKSKQEFVQPVHLRFVKPKKADLCKMRRLYEPSMAGYNCHRSDFAVEFDNNAEQVLSLAGQLNDLRVYPKIDEENGRLFNSEKREFHDEDLLEGLEIAIIEGYNSRLHERERKKKIIKEFGIINQRAILAWHNKFEASLGKDEFKKLIRFIQFQTYAEAGIIFSSLELMYEKRAEINKMLFYRTQRGISTHTDISIFESLRPKFEPKVQRTDISNMSYAPSSIEVCSKPRKKSNVELFGMPRYKELSNIEAELCTTTRLTPEFFLEAKAILIADCKKNNGILLKRARKLFRKDVNKTRKIFNLLLEQGLIWLPELLKN